MSDMSRRRVLAQGAAGLTAATAVTAVTGWAASPAPVPAAAATPAPAAYGVLPLDQFSGSDDDKLAAALSHAKARTYAPTIVLSNRAHTFTRTVPLDFPGVRLSGPLGGMAREFASTVRVACPAGGLFSVVRDTTKDVAITGLTFTGSGRFIADTPLDASGPVLTDTTISDCGFTGFSGIVVGSVLRLSVQRIYANNLTGSGFVLGGSDSWLFTEGPNYMSGDLPADTPYVDLVHLSQSQVGRLYVTAQGGYGLRIRDTFGGLRVQGYMSDGTGRTGASATQRQGLLITGGTGITIRDFWCFNANASGDSPGQVVVTGGDEILLDAPVFPKTMGRFTALDTSTPCIHTEVPIVVANPTAPGGYPKRLRQSRAGLITLTGAPGWTIETAAAPGAAPN